VEDWTLTYPTTDFFKVGNLQQRKNEGKLRRMSLWKTNPEVSQTRVEGGVGPEERGEKLL